MLTRGANLQKHCFKTAPRRRFLGITPEVLSDGDHTLLANGFWGVSRHVNYLGEIIQVVAMAPGVPRVRPRAPTRPPELYF